MGNGVGKLTVCFTGGNHVVQKDMDMVMFDPIDDLGHSFCYVRPDPTRISSSKVHSEETTTFRSISGASVSANTSTPLSTSLIDLHSYNSIDRASVFESSTSFASISLQAQRRNSGPLQPAGDRGFLSGPLDRGFQSGPLLSGPLDQLQVQFQRSYSHGGFAFRRRSRRGSVIGLIRKAVSKTISRRQNSVSVVAPVKGGDWEKNNNNNNGGGYNFSNKKESTAVRSSQASLEDDESSESQDLQWAQGKAGEDRVHVVVSEEQGWVFVGIYDGFNGPDAPDYLVSNLYPAVDRELRELLRDDSLESWNSESPESKRTDDDHEAGRVAEDSEENKRRRSKNNSIRVRNGKKWKNHRRWKCEFDRERLELKQELNSKGGGGGGVNHSAVLKALFRGLKKTEEAYLDITDMMLVENPELALMGSCVLVMLMKGEDVYVMNVGDSRALLARKPEPDIWRQDLERINEETLYDLQVSCRDDDDDYDEDHNLNNPTTSLTALQLSMDHSTSIQGEVERIKSEHPDDPCAIVNDRVKGSLKVTRAFGAGFLKQPKWNNALLEMFRIDYVGNSPYLNCLPYLCHHRLGPRDRFLILSSDGLYQYLTNEEAVSEVELFFQWSPEGDPAQHLVEEVLLRAARKAGLDFHELLEIPQGDRRRYHDDISIIVISLQGRIWRSCV